MFQVKLMQKEWFTTEIFDSADQQVFPETPTTADEAKAAVEKFVAEHKELDNAEWKLEVVEIPEEVEAAEPTEE